jgi:hypothetical protein
MRAMSKPILDMAEKLRISLDFSNKRSQVMTDVQVEGATPSTIFDIPVSKGRSGTVQVDTAKLAEYMYIQSLKDGIKVNVNRGMSTIKQENYKTFQEFQAAAMNKAKQNVEAMYTGTMTVRGATKSKADGVPTEVKTLARNMARAIVKAEAKKKGYKVSLIKSSVITQHANALLAARPELLEKAAAQIEAERQATEDNGGIDFGDNPEDEGLRTKAAQAKAAKQLSAAKAGKVAGRGRPQAN